FISLFLGLASGLQPIDPQTDATVRSIRVLVDGREIAALTKPPWHFVFDFGPQLDPREVEAIAFDEDGNEIGRTPQVINLPRPPAELEIALENREGGQPAGAT